MSDRRLPIAAIAIAGIVVVLGGGIEIAERVAFADGSDRDVFLARWTFKLHDVSVLGYAVLQKCVPAAGGERVGASRRCVRTEVADKLLLPLEGCLLRCRILLTRTLGVCEGGKGESEKRDYLC